MSEKLGSERFNIVRAQEQILSNFSPEQQIEIRKRLNVLSSIVYFIGQDFEIGIELNKPGEGWHWDFKDNIVRVDPKDLLERPIEYSCYVMGHEAGHRRISRTHFIPKDVWEQPGFGFLMNAIEDPRENNFVADNYPMFAKRLHIAFEQDWDLEKKAKELVQERIGRTPRFMQAGFEYIRLWFLERLNEQEFAGLDKEHAVEKLTSMIQEDLPDEVKQVVLQTLSNARDSWWLYPTKKEADGKGGEEIISEYAEGSYIINHEDIWPEFKKLIDEDIKDEKTKQLIDELKKQKQEKQKQEKQRQEQEDSESGEGEEKSSREDDERDKGEDGESKEKGEKTDEKTEGEQGEGEKGGESQELTPEEIQKMLDEMSDGERDELEKRTQQKAQQIIDELAKEIAKEMQGKMTETPDQTEEESKEQESEVETKKDSEKIDAESESESESESEGEPKSSKPKESLEDARKREQEIEKIRNKLQENADKDLGRYERDRRDVSPIINRLTNDLRAIFSERKKTKVKSGFGSGRTIDISRRITEIAKGILPIDSKAWTRKEKPTEKDYAFSILVDLSGSMQNYGRIEETFKAVIALSEVLHNLGIKFNVTGFNDRLHDFIEFGKKLDKEKRKNMEQMVREVKGSTAIGDPGYNDDGWAVSEASKKLSERKESHKILIVLSDGEPYPSSAHGGNDFELSKVVEEIEKKGTHEIIGLGLGSGTGHVSHYYPKHNIANIPVQELPSQLAKLLKDIVEK